MLDLENAEIRDRANTGTAYWPASKTRCQDCASVISEVGPQVVYRPAHSCANTRSASL
jgi:hypothetical protein